MADATFSNLSDDVVLKIFFQLEDDPRNWARLSCVCRKFSSLITTICCKSKCLSTIPSISGAGDLLPGAGDWASLHKIAVCCPGLVHAGVLLDNSDFGLQRELGPDENYVGFRQQLDSDFSSSSSTTQIENQNQNQNRNRIQNQEEGVVIWSLYDDLYFDTIYNNSESQESYSAMDVTLIPGTEDSQQPQSQSQSDNEKKRKVFSRSHRSHLASGLWNLSREQGNKLLASRFRGDSLYICDWPGCVHNEEKRNYMLFRGFFNNFKRSRVWRTINDGNRSRIDLNCAFCSCKETWDLHSAFCLKRGFGFHDDGEPVVRAYVCENGHVSGAWTDSSLYT